MRKVLDWITWQRIPADQIGFKNLEQESRTLILYSLFYILLAFGVGNLIIHFPQPILGAKEFVQDFWYAAVFKFSFLFILPSLIFFKRWKYGIQDLLFGLKPKIEMVINGALLITIDFLLNIRHISRVSEAMPSFEDAEFRLILGIVIPLLIAGLPEELFFRGMLQTRLEKLWNTPIAILVSGLLFTAWHLPSRYLLANGVEGQAGDWVSILLGTGLPVFLVSCFFGWHWARYRNLPLLIGVHWAIDILPSLSSFFGVSN